MRRSDGYARFLVAQDLPSVGKDIAALGDETVILCTDQYTIYDGIDEYDGVDAHLAINHSEGFVVGDAHVNHCENRHSILRGWLRKFRGVAKQRLQGYLDFLSLCLNTDDWFAEIVRTDVYT